MHQRYPRSWGQPLEKPDAGCVAVSGVYENLETRTDSSGSLIALLLTGSSEPPPAITFTERTSIASPHLAPHAVEIDVRDSTLRFVLRLAGGPPLEHTIRRGDRHGEFTCEDGRVTWRTRDGVFDFFMGYAWSTYTLQRAPDGSLVLGVHDRALGVLLFVIPFPASAKEWHLFRATTSEPN